MHRQEPILIPIWPLQVSYLYKRIPFLIIAFKPGVTERYEIPTIIY